jgi:hypothetical protein
MFYPRTMQVEPVEGKPLRFPPGRVRVHLTGQHRSAYRRLYASYCTILEGLPVLRDRDFDGRAVQLTRAELDALNRAFASLADPPSRDTGTPFETQELSRTTLFKRLQYLS